MPNRSLGIADEARTIADMLSGEHCALFGFTLRPEMENPAFRGAGSLELIGYSSIVEVCSDADKKSERAGF
jgi:hypothetical protein